MTIHYTKEQKNYWKVTNAEAFSVSGWICSEQGLQQVSMVCSGCQGSSLKKERTLSQTDQLKRKKNTEQAVAIHGRGSRTWPAAPLARCQPQSTRQGLTAHYRLLPSSSPRGHCFGSTQGQPRLSKHWSYSVAPGGGGTLLSSEASVSQNGHKPHFCWATPSPHHLSDAICKAHQWWGKKENAWVITE